jgi:hypothetical protein
MIAGGWLGVPDLIQWRASSTTRGKLHSTVQARSDSTSEQEQPPPPLEGRWIGVTVAASSSAGSGRPRETRVSAVVGLCWWTATKNFDQDRIYEHGPATTAAAALLCSHSTPPGKAAGGGGRRGPTCTATARAKRRPISLARKPAG